MVATQKTIRELAPYVTAFVEVVDARAPSATAHPPLLGWVGKTPVFRVLNKAELADERVTQQWLTYLGRSEGHIADALALSANASGARSALESAIRRRLPPPFRLSMVGMPNVGKSTLLNRMVGRRRVAVGAKPGLTRGPQWIRPGEGWEWLDLPGVVAPRRAQDWRLKVLGVVAVDAEEMETVAEELARQFPQLFAGDWLEWGRARGYLARGGTVDRMRTAQAVLRQFQTGGLGRVSLEIPPVGGEI